MFRLFYQDQDNIYFDTRAFYQMLRLQGLDPEQVFGEAGLGTAAGHRFNPDLIKV